MIELRSACELGDGASLLLLSVAVCQQRLLKAQLWKSLRGYLLELAVPLCTAPNRRWSTESALCHDKVHTFC